MWRYDTDMVSLFFVLQHTSSGTTVYSNVIKAYISGDNFVTRKHFKKGVRILFHVKCERKHPKHFVAKDDITPKQHSKQNVTVSFYDSSFRTPIYNPYVTYQNKDVFLQASLPSSDGKLVLFIHTCVVSPDISDFKTLTYDLIRNGWVCVTWVIWNIFCCISGSHNQRVNHLFFPWALQSYEEILLVKCQINMEFGYFIDHLAQTSFNEDTRQQLCFYQFI